MGEPQQELRDWLTHDHQEIDGFLQDALANEGFDPVPFAKFRERLLRHIGIEERILFPAVREHISHMGKARLADLRVEHAALTTLLVPTPDRALVLEIQSLLTGHNAVEEADNGVYDECIAALADKEALRVLDAARTRKPVPTTGYFDGPGTVRTAAEALAKARRTSRSASSSSTRP
jgi:hypothetical protein